MNQVHIAPAGLDELIGHEWLTVNHLGGFASSTIAAMNTRKYHGLLVAAMAPPVRQMVLLSRVEETVYRNGWPYALGCNEYPGTIHPQGHLLLKAFGCAPYPRWAYQGDGWTVQKELQLLDGHNTVCLSYALLAGETPIDLEVRPLFALRGIHDLMYQWNGQLAAQPLGNGQLRIPPTSRTPEVFFAHAGGTPAQFEAQGYWYLNTIYRREQERGYAGLEDLWMPGTLRWTLAPGQVVHFICSADPINAQGILDQLDAQEQAIPVTTSVIVPTPITTASSRTELSAPLDALVRAADQFIVRTRQQLTAIVAGYPWVKLATRDALVSIGGLLLIAGRFAEAASLLETYAGQLRDGLIPSEFPCSAESPTYESADASLWFVNAVHHYLRYTGDEQTVRRLFLEPVDRVIDAYCRGTHLGICIDTSGLLVSRQSGTPTTWMNAKLDTWVVTPRQGRAVELNALWYNALCIAQDLAERFGHGAMAAQRRALAARAAQSFNEQFWNDAAGCLFDVIDEQSRDAAVRPNQILAVSLPYPILDATRHAPVLQRVCADLVTPFGVRSLAPAEPGYQGRYRGDIVSRDRAYHQGSAYPWLLGPLVSAHVRVHGRGEAARRQARSLVQGCLDYLCGDGLGQLPELFDGDSPHRPGGLPASALSVGEVLRAYVEDVLDQCPADLEAQRRRLLPVAMSVPARVP